jgi:Holliday junction resolvasome RuvABC endonuclease subunit
MRVLGLDPATVCGFADGPAEAKPEFGSFRVRSKDERIEVGPFNMLAWLRDRWETYGPPDFCAVEHYMEPAAQPSSTAIPLQIMLYGVIVAMCRANGVAYATPTRIEVLKHFVGQTKFRGTNVKQAVVARCHLLGLMPEDVWDEDAADAIATRDWGVGHWRLQSKIKPNLVMFGS